MKLSGFLLLITFTVGLGGCSNISLAPVVEGDSVSGGSESGSAEEYANDKGREIVHHARGVLGVSYRYGGADPSGFDCSGLVEYSHLHAGISVPRTSTAQYESAHPVSRTALQPGDVIFFSLNQGKTSHVGIYAGEGRFIHAPSSGKQVSFSNLGEPYWEKRITKTGRLY